MKIIETKQLKDGMILGESIIDSSGVVELLSKGTQLTQRHIELISNLGFTEVKVLEHENEAIEDVALDVHAFKENASKNGDAFDLMKLLNDLDEIDNHVYEPTDRSVVNRNMEVHVLTGEGNIPIDVKHQKMVDDTKEVFRNIRETGELDLERIKNNVEEALPDMIRNNDVLMRLNQLKESDDYTFQHSLRVSILATMIGKWLGYSQEELIELGEAGLLYDIGKMNIPEFIVKKDENVNAEEFELIKKHAQFGYSILLKTKGVSSNIKYAALHHHERMDGSGYPLRLRENQIHDFAKIIMVCDVFDAMITDRPYRKGISPLLAADYLSWSSGKLFDAEVCYIFIKKLSEYYVGKQVRLSTGETGKIVFIDHNYPTRPLVQVGDRFVDLAKDRSVHVEVLM
ncbi:MAG: HD-GYP domain-containing protein [Clostridiales bacterium]|nr:HD-GYP domain-containing protein [Clostridiales bacterium]